MGSTLKQNRREPGTQHNRHCCFLQEQKTRLCNRRKTCLHAFSRHTYTLYLRFCQSAPQLIRISSTIQNTEQSFRLSSHHLTPTAFEVGVLS